MAVMLLTKARLNLNTRTPVGCPVHLFTNQINSPCRPKFARIHGRLCLLLICLSAVYVELQRRQQMDDYQKFEFDLHGVIVVKGVLDPATVAELRSILCVLSHACHPLPAGG